MEGSASGDVAEAAGHVRPVWAETDGDVSRWESPEGKVHGKRYRSSGFGGKSGDFGLPKKVLDKGPPW